MLNPMVQSDLVTGTIVILFLQATNMNKLFRISGEFPESISLTLAWGIDHVNLLSAHANEF